MISTFPVVACPHCGTTIRIDQHNRPIIQHCSTDDGGCDNYFVCEVTPVHSYDVKVGKIEYIEAVPAQSTTPPITGTS